MRVHVARLGLDAHQDAPVAKLEQLAELDRIGDHELADPISADVILFPQCHMLPRDWRLDTIRQHPLTVRHREKVMVFDERDRPWCGFPGIYVSMPRGHFDRRYQRPWGYFPTAPLPDSRQEPDLLYSFVGSPSHRCRKRLLELRHPDAVVEQVRGFTFYDPTSVDFERRRAHFRSIVMRSRFVLCPRGKGTSSIRLYETLAAGRVPVIISDDWVAPDGPGWERFSLIWPEAKLAGLVELLEETDDHWAEMSARARAAYQEFFAPDAWFGRVMDLCRDLQRSGCLEEFPKAGKRDAAFFAAGAGVARWRATNGVRRTGKRILQRPGLTEMLAKPWSRT
jgi:exostosin family protein